MKRTFLKKSNVTKALAALAMTASFGIMASCTDYSEFSEEDLKHQQDLKSYTEMFKAMFGEFDPNHTWGMKDEMKPLSLGSSMGTRAESTASSVLVNRNQWTEFNSTDNVKFPDYGTGAPDVTVPVFKENDPNVIGHSVQIPGYPHLNGLYYTVNGNTLDPNYRTGDGRNGSTMIHSGDIPAGDVTDYEIQYVSAWFRTHPNPESIDLHLTDFFIQNVSCDADQVRYDALTAPDPSSPYAGWPQTGRNGKNIETKEEASTHYGSSFTEPVGYDLDYLGFKDMDGNWTHVNNFNRGNSNPNPEYSNSNPNREIKYVKSAGTEDFTCRSSWSTSNNEASPWVLVHLTWNETVKHDNSPYPKGTVIPREGYYLAFDFDGTKGEQHAKADGYYSNWIVKITPAYYTPKADVRRIMVEDLGGALDFDFNDAVVDVAYEQKGSQYQALLYVQATGATMPIVLENEVDKTHEENDYEIHNLLGHKGVMKQINVDDSKFETHAPAIIRSKKLYDSPVGGNIHLMVHNTRNGQTYDVIDHFKDDPNNDRTESLNGSTYGDPTIEDGKPVYTGTNIAPRAFAVPTSDVKWMKEYKPIDTAYEHFKNWVGNANWTLNGDGVTKWYNITTDEANLLYTPKINMKPNSPTHGGGSGSALNWVDLKPDAGALSLISGVKADSYLKLNGYSGPDAIVTKLSGMGDRDRITFTVVLASNTKYEDNGTDASIIEGIFTPADVSGATMSNNGTTFTTSQFTRFTKAALVPTNHDFCSDPASCNGDAGHVHTYTLQFSFAKSDLVNSAHTEDLNPGAPYHDYLLVFLKVGGDAATVGQGTMTQTNGTVEGTNNGVTVKKWYVHY